MSEQSNESISALSRIPADTREGRDALEAAIGRWLTHSDQAKWPRGLQFFENASYLLGNHLTRFYYTADAGFGFHQFGIHDQSQFDNLVAKSADNKLIRPTETVASMLTQSEPGGRVNPNSDLPEDEDAAELAEIVLDLFWEKPLNMRAKTREVALLGCITGTAAIEIEYGPSNVAVEVPSLKTRKVTDPLSGEEVEETYEDPSETEVLWKPDLQARVWNTFHLTPDPAATSPDDMEWIARSSFEDLDWIKDNFDKDEPGYYPENLEGLRAEPATDKILFWWAKFQDILETPQYFQHGGGMTAQTFGAVTGYAPNQTIMTVFDVRPSAEHPRGRTIIVTGGKIIYEGDARAWSEKYPWRWHPYAFWGWFKLPGRFFHVPLLSQLVPLQKKINAIDTLVQANRQFVSIGQWLIPRHSKVSEGMTSGIPGQGLNYTDVPGMRGPEKIQNVPLPQELLIERQQLEQSIEFIAASGSTDPQIAKSAMRSGAMLDHLRQEKLRSKTPMIQEFEQMVETVAQNILIEIQLHLLEEDPELTQRIRAAAREHSGQTIESFTGASLRDHHAVKIDIASRLLKAPEAKEAKALEFFQYSGGQVSAEERQGIMQAIGMDEFVKNEEAASVKYARRLISRISTGQLPEVPEEQIPALLMPKVAKAAVMLPIFAKTMLQPKFNDWEPEAKALLMNLWGVCQQLSEMEMMEQMQKQMMMMSQAEQAPGGGAAGQ
jgi:hypothetical protein